MNKKLLLMVAGTAITACCLGACAKRENDGDYSKLNKMLNADYSKVVISVTDTFDDDTVLESKYTVKYSKSEITVEYSVEEFNEISLDNPSSEVKTTLSGVAVIKNGKISYTGDVITLSESIATLEFTFKETYFKHIQMTDNKFFADVDDVESFFGSKLSCSNMRVNATFNGVFEDIQITYTNESGNKIKYIYTFTA